MLHIYTKNSVSEIYFSNHFNWITIIVLYFFITWLPVDRCFDSFCMHAKKEDFAEDGAYEARH